MKYRVNLYSEQFRPRSHLLDLRSMGLYIGLIMVLLIASGIWLTWGNQGLKQQNQLSETQRTELEGRMLELTKKLQGRGNNPAIHAEMVEKSNAIAGKRQMINLLANSQLLADTQFSKVMRGLSKSSVKGLWLTRVRANGEHLVLHGCSLSEALLPKWIDQLSTQEEFDGKKFGVLELFQPEEKTATHLNFHLSTQLDREAENNG